MVANASAAVLPQTIGTRPLEPQANTQAYVELVDMAHKRTGNTPEVFIAEHVLRVSEGAHWPIQRAALEAITRRFTTAKKEQLQIVSRPASVQSLGIYTLRSQRGTLRPYQILMVDMNPLGASCDCSDYRRNSLGLCKHIATILNALFLKKGVTNQPFAFPQTLVAEPRLAWYPVRPLQGAGDWLERVSYVAAPSMPQQKQPAIFDLFTTKANKYFLKNTYANSPEKRLEMVEQLQRFLQHELGQKKQFPSDTALRPLLKAEEVCLRSRIQGQLYISTFKQKLKSLKRKLYPYQLQGVQKFLQTGILLLADDMGLGKTTQAIAGAHVLWHQKQITRGLVIAPVSLKSQWRREWQEFTDIPITLVDGTREQRQLCYDQCKHGFLIVNYEQVVRDVALLQAWNPDMVILDEAQRIKNWQTKTSTHIKQLTPRYRLVLTGTPMENRLDELSSLLDWLDDMALAPVWRLSPWHLVAVDGQRDIGGIQHLSTIRTRLSHCFMRRTRQEVLPQLPARTDTTVPIAMTDQQRGEHDEFIVPIAKLLNAAKRRPLTQQEFLRLMSCLTMQRMICNASALYHFETLWDDLRKVDAPSDEFLAGLASPKLLELRERIVQLVVEQERKVVIFSQWRRMLQLADWCLQPLLKRKNVRALYFSGQESQRRRSQNIIEFHDDPQARVLLATDAGGVGLNLQHAANCVINLDMPWNPAVLEQRIGRIYRLGQKDPIEVYNLVCEEGIESRIVELVGMKKAVFNGLFESNSDEVQFERSGSFLNRVERVLNISSPKSDDALLIERETEVDEDATPDVNIFPDDESTTEQSQVFTNEVAISGAIPAPLLVNAVDTAPSTSVTDMFKGLNIQTAPDGQLTITAPPQTARLLSQLFLTLAQKLTQASTA